MFVDLWVVKVKPDSIILDKALNGDAGFDLFAQEAVVIEPSKWKKIPLGIIIELPQGFVGLVTEKSGLAVRYGLFSIAGVIDSNYRGEIHAIMYNGGSSAVIFKRGDKVAQLLVMPCYTGQRIEIRPHISCETVRGDKGFGSTGDSYKNKKQES